MNWLLIIAILVAIYACAALWLHQAKHRRELDSCHDGEPKEGEGLSRYLDNIMFYGPIMAIKTTKTSFLDFFKRFSGPLRIYASAGVVAVVIVSVLMALLLLLSVRFTLLLQPEPTGIYKPQNILLIPGVNEYVPSTFAVWFAFVLTIAIHEFGHGILCRIENIRVNGIGALIAVIPIGFFVEPDEAELEKSPRKAKVRMYGAGITNNLVVGLSCFVLMVFVAQMAVPTGDPVIAGVYQDYPAAIAGVPPNSVIKELNGVPVADRNQISTMLNSTVPGDRVVLTVRQGDVLASYPLVLSAWPESMGERHNGFMGVTYYDAQAFSAGLPSFLSPLGFVQFLAVPFDTSTGGKYFRILAFESPDQVYYTAPFAGFWSVVHLLFWCGWININVGIFNAIPMVPLDGGYIFREGLTGMLEKRKLTRYAPGIAAAISALMMTLLVSIILLPYLLHL